ncbi:glutamate-1-semialdehyde 2,1-aminomutase [soil metagenome]
MLSQTPFPAHGRQLNSTSRKTEMRFDLSVYLQSKFHNLIPGGGHTYAKGDDQFPEFMPPYIVRGKGCRIWDVDGNEFIEYGMGLRSVVLGHAFGPVINAAARQMKLGTNFGRPSVIELECAEMFLSMVEGADMVKFCKNGSDALDGAIRLSRAYTGRDMIGVCADHPFFSSGDWFIGRTAMNSGIPQSVRKLTVNFKYNNLPSAKLLFDEHPGEIACLILEPQKYEEPVGDYLNQLKDLCHRNGALLILDEMITGFRWHTGGAQKKFGVIPDLSTWGKALGNGFSIAALAGRREIMKLGGIRQSEERVFLLSTTHGAESHSLAAGIATMKFFRDEEVVEMLYQQGERLKEGIMNASRNEGLQDHVKVAGPSCCSVYTTLDELKKPSQPFRTLFIQETLRRGLLMPSTAVSYSHTDADIDETISKVQEVLMVYSKAFKEGINKYLMGRPVQPVWRKYNQGNEI